MCSAHRVGAQAAQALASAEIEEMTGDQALLREMFALRRLERLSSAASADSARERKAVRRDRAEIAPGPHTS